jgi:alpha-D-ribose 1-methylphosphonate 5-triphosphate diphosphatase
VELAFRNARIVTRDEDFIGSVQVRDGRVAAIDRGAGGAGEDFEGDVLMAGIIDIHTDNLERHFFPRPNIDWNPVSAAVVHDGGCLSVGVTTVYDSLTLGSFNGAAARGNENMVRLTDGLTTAREAGMLKADHRIHWRCETTSDDMTAWLGRFADHPLGAMFSLMDHTPGQRQYRDIDKHLQNWRSNGMTDAAVETRLDEWRERQARNADTNARLVAETAKARGAALVSHDDETEAHIDLAADLGATVAEFPVTPEAAARARARGMAIVMGGPNLIRGGSYSGNVPAAELAEMDLLDAFASDYVPRSLLECAFRLTASDFGWTMSRALATVTANVAQAAGLQDRGAIAPGLRADLLRVRPVDRMPILRGVWSEGRRVA